VTVVIPGAKNVRQAQENAEAADVPALSAETMARIGEIYERYAKPSVHQRW
jgi:aryl-alcohol dehydrogenase-like predicted oxidoreductase